MSKRKHDYVINNNSHKNTRINNTTLRTFSQGNGTEPIVMTCVHTY